MSGVLRGNCCETYRNIPQKTFIKKFNNSLIRHRCFFGMLAATSNK